MAAVRSAFGVLLLAAPAPVLRLLGGGAGAAPRARAVVRILGARHLIEAGVVNLHPAPGWAWLGTGVDATHAATAIGFAAIDARWRREALLNAVIASSFAVGGARHALALRDRRGSPGQ